MWERHNQLVALLLTPAYMHHQSLWVFLCTLITCSAGQFFPCQALHLPGFFFSDCMCCLLQHYTHTDRDCGFKISPKPLDKMFNIGRSFLSQLIFYKNGDGALYLALLEKTLVEYLRIWDFTWTPNKDRKRSKDMLLFFFFFFFELEPVLHSAGRG